MCTFHTRVCLCVRFFAIASAKVQKINGGLSPFPLKFSLKFVSVKIK